MKKVIILSGLFLLLCHFAALLIYLLKPVSPVVNYVYPYFHQSWELFTPAPDNNYRLYVSNGNGAWKDIAGEIMLQHAGNRFLGMETPVIALTNSIHYFEKNAADRNFKGGKVSNDINFSIVEKFAIAYINYSGGDSLTELKLILVVDNLHGATSRIYYN